MKLFGVRITLSFKWYDMWVGAFVNVKKKCVYICLPPVVAWKLEFDKGGMEMINASQAKELATSKQPSGSAARLIRNAEKLIHSRAANGLFFVEIDIRSHGNVVINEFTGILEDQGYVVTKVGSDGKSCTTLMIRWE